MALGTRLPSTVLGNNGWLQAVTYHFNTSLLRRATDFVLEDIFIAHTAFINILQDVKILTGINESLGLLKIMNGSEADEILRTSNSLFDR